MAPSRTAKRCCGFLAAAGPAALLALLLAEPPAPGPRAADPPPLRPGGRLPVADFRGSSAAGTPARAVYLRRQAGDGIPTESCYGIVNFSLPDVQEGHVRVRTRYISIDPGPMRGQLGHSGEELSVDPSDPKAFWQLFPHFIRAEAVGIVEESRAESLPVGTVVRASYGMLDVTVAPASSLDALAPHHDPPSLALGVLGVTGRTAFYGMQILSPRPGQTLLVTGAAGATGSVAGQLGKIAGCRVIGSAGTAAKVRHLVDVLGFDGAFNYRKEDASEALARLAPQGIDLLFENTGGPVSEAAFRRLNEGAKVAVSGLINWYHTPPTPLRRLRALLPSSTRAALATLASPRDIAGAVRARALMLRMMGWHGLIHLCNRDLVTKAVSVGGPRFTVEHFLVVCFDHWGGQGPAEEALAGHVRAGRLRAEETVLRGSLEDAPRAAINVWSGGNTGKQLLELTL